MKRTLDGWLPSRRLRRENAALRAINNFALSNKRCDASSPQGEYLCDREPGHEGKHANWQAVEWSQEKR